MVTCYGVDALQWTPEQAMGMRANMKRSYAQQKISAKDYGAAGDDLGQGVYDLFLLAYGKKSIADEARISFLASRELKK